MMYTILAEQNQIAEEYVYQDSLGYKWQTTTEKLFHGSGAMDVANSVITSLQFLDQRRTELQLKKIPGQDSDWSDCGHMSSPWSNHCGQGGKMM